MFLIIFTISRSDNTLIIRHADMFPVSNIAFQIINIMSKQYLPSLKSLLIVCTIHIQRFCLKITLHRNFHKLFFRFAVLLIFLANLLGLQCCSVWKRFLWLSMIFSWPLTWATQMVRPTKYNGVHVYYRKYIHRQCTYTTLMFEIYWNNWVLNDRSGVQAVWPKSQVHASLQEDERGERYKKNTGSCETSI